MFERSPLKEASDWGGSSEDLVALRELHRGVLTFRKEDQLPFAWGGTALPSWWSAIVTEMLRFQNASETMIGRCYWIEYGDLMWTRCAECV